MKGAGDLSSYPLKNQRFSKNLFQVNRFFFFMMNHVLYNIRDRKIGI
jgi:hypothetical protein